MLDGRWRPKVDRWASPLGVGLVKLGVKADQLTAAGVVLSVAAAGVIASGHLVAGAGAVALTGAPDLLDGAVAKASSSTSARGAFFDSVADRVSDSMLLGGVAWYLGTSRGAHWAVLAMAVLGVSLLISYERARAESLGLSARGGLMERAERTVLLGVGLLLPGLLVPMLFVLLGLSVVTAGQRFVMVWSQAGEARTTASGRPVAAGQPALGAAGSRPRRRAQHRAAGGSRLAAAGRLRARAEGRALDGGTGRLGYRMSRVGYRGSRGPRGFRQPELPGLGTGLPDERPSAAARVEARWKAWRDASSTEGSSTEGSSEGAVVTGTDEPGAFYRWRARRAASASNWARRRRSRRSW